VPVRLLLTSGGQRIVHHADAARRDGPFFIVFRSDPDPNRCETLLTLRADEVIGAEIIKDGINTEYIPGGGHAD
jgi:hypothetical protein